MRKSRIAIGCRFGRLTVIGVDGRNRRCACDCGTHVTVLACNLATGNTSSCGCLRREIEPIAALSHGATKDRRWTRAYTIYHGMLQRCLNPKNPGWPTYGGRGIYVCNEWLDSFRRFLADMGEPPPGSSLDRIDNDGPYCKENCRWATDFQQARNRRSSRILTFDGKSQSLADWAEEIRVDYFTLHGRLKRGWSVERALSTGVANV